jgi:hypothetical protein
MNIFFRRRAIENCNRKGKIKNYLYSPDMLKTKPKFEPKENNQNQYKWVKYIYFGKGYRTSPDYLKI